MEEWERWELIEGIEGRFFIENFQVSAQGLSIRLCATKENKKIEILFFNGADAFRWTNESWCFDVFAVLGNKYGDDFYANWSFFKIVNSNYAKSLSLTSCGLSDDRKFDHFCIVGNDEMIDVLTTYNPVITML